MIALYTQTKWIKKGAVTSIMAALTAYSGLAWSANLIVNNGFENNPPNAMGNNIGASIAPWVIGTGGQSNVVAVNGGESYGNNGPALDAEEQPAGAVQHYLDISGGSNTISQTFTVPTCGATDLTERLVNFSGYFSVRDSQSTRGFGYIRILDNSVQDSNGNPKELVKIDTGYISPTDANGVNVPPRIQVWKPFGGSVAVMPGHQITYQAYITNNLNFDNAYMAFSDFACPSTTLAMAKQWNGAISGHVAELSATRDNETIQIDQLTATADGSTDQLIQDSTPFTVFAGDKIRISETLKNIGSTTYSQAFSCTGDTTTTEVKPGVFDVEIGSVSVNTDPIVCIMVNTNTTQSTLKLTKRWDGANEGDTATITAVPQQPAGGVPTPLVSIATSLANGATGQLQSGVATVVPQGASFNIEEDIDNSAASPAVYDTELNCTRTTQNGQTITIDPAPGTQAECTMKNTLAALTVLKQASAPSDTNSSGIVGDVGDEITYTFTVTNSGRADLNDVQIEDAMLQSAQVAISWNSQLPISLTPGQSVTATAVYTINSDDVASQSGKIINQATASAVTKVKNRRVTSLSNATETPVQAAHPKLSIVKSAHVSDTNNSSILADVGDQIVYSVTVANSGDTHLYGVTISDPLEGLSSLDIAWPNQAIPGTLPVGSQATATATYVIQQKDLAAGHVYNKATASANPIAGIPVDSVSDDTTVITQKPTVIATPVPTTNTWALLMLASALGLTASRVRRKI
ncbi:DUF11 domain-containing protein [Lampropedia puyangensis]|uniref:DUF11 domain-containing protein n=1 Tax=Lampropedia puyangensis TaxID=1330072 RepID=A0A4S8FCC8_9BURK|nr:DUF11 domain-containing protein [Lampropedia puyangensis]THU04515.1 DUF11 domain-containing protein [Lampropedia puyangensis]